MIDRRTPIQSAPVAALAISATAAIAETNELGSDELKAAMSRARFFAETIGKEPPSRLLSDDGAPSHELLAFCEETGMSLDWVFLDDLRSMVRATYRDRQNTLEAA